MSMSTDMKVQLKKLLIHHEGCRTLPYLDTATPPRITIGIGRNLTDRGVLPAEIELMVQNDIDYFYGYLGTHYEWFLSLDDARQLALVDMCFMGVKSFGEFVKMLDALADGKYDTAADNILDSEYAKQVGQRAVDIATIIRTGILDD